MGEMKKGNYTKIIASVFNILAETFRWPIGNSKLELRRSQ
jgi:hypothetical protein